MTSRLLHRAACLAAALAFLAAPSVTHADPYSIEGKSAGEFLSPSGDLFYDPTGVGTGNLEWGLVERSSLQYSSSTFTANAGEKFVLGELTLFNGHVLDATQLASVALKLTLNLDAPPVTGQGLGDGPISLDSEQKLFLFFPYTTDTLGLPDLSTTVTFSSGGVDYTLDVLGFGKLTNNGTTFDPITSIKANTGHTASVKLYGTFTATPAVPEPASIAVVAIAGLFGLGHAIRRRRSAASA